MNIKNIHIRGVLLITLLLTGPLKMIVYPTNISSIDIPIMDDVRVLSEEEILVSNVTNNINDNLITYEFFSNMFGISLDTLKSEVIEYSLDNNITLDTDKDILEFISNLKSTNETLFKDTYTYLEYSKDYVYGLIDYFCSIYTNVDSRIAKAISMVETGNLEAKSMMKRNNIFGGMSGGKLTKYNNIEYGVYKYIKLLSNSYFGKGLTTIESIGYKYNPITTDTGKVANPTWVSNVYMYYNKLDTNKVTSIDELLNLK